MMVILAVIFYLAMNNFKSVAPSAIEVQKHNDARRAGRDVRSEQLQEDNPTTSATADSWNPQPPVRPSLSTVDQKTSQHAGEVKDALSQAN